MKKKSYIIFSDMQADHKRICCELDINTIDITNIFPIDKQETLVMFMSNWDGEFWRRKTAFEAMLYEIATTDSDVKCFATKLMNKLFTRTYIKNYKWPTSRYILLTYLIT